MSRFAVASSLSCLMLLAACGTPHAPQGTAPAAVHGLYKVGEPYQIAGVWYYPAEDMAYDETGIASWYGEQFHGKFTANGEIFDLNALTAAHRTLPMPSIVQVTNLENGRTLQLRVNDRGPFARGRILDLSRRAAQLLGLEGAGTAKVRVKILTAESIQAKLIAMHDAGQDRVAGSTPLPVAPVAVEKAPTPAGVKVAAGDLPLPVRRPPPPAPVEQASYHPPPLPEKIVTMPVRATSIYVQAGAFSQVDNATRLKAKLAKLGDAKVTDAKINGAFLYRVRLGPVPSVDEADRLLDRVVASGVSEARIVVD